MNKHIDPSASEAKKAVGAVVKSRAGRREPPSSETSGDGTEASGMGKGSAKEIFEEARAKQDEDFIRHGKPE